MFYNFFRKNFFKLWKDIENNDIKNSQNFKPLLDVKKETYYLDDKEDFSNLIKIFRHKDSTKNNPTLINIHGGAWTLKNWIGYEPFYEYFAQHGFNVIGFSYPSLEDNFLFIDIVHHIFNVIHYLYENKERFNISFDNTFLAGDSAGGQLTLFVDALNRSKKLQDVFDVKPFKGYFKGLILNHPVCYLDEAANIKNHNILSKYVFKPSFLRMMFGKNYLANPNYFYSNPDIYLKMIDNYPQVFLLTSNGDIHYKDNSMKLKDSLARLNFRLNYYYENDPNSRHVYNIAELDKEYSIKVNQEIIRFMRNLIV